MIWPYLFDGLKCIQFDTNNGDLLKTLHVNGFIGVSILCATDRFIAPNTHVHCTQNTNENKSHNYICPLGKWYRFPIQKTPCKFNCIYWQAYTHKREKFFSWFDRMCHNNDRKNSSFCRILHILFSRLSHFALGSFFCVNIFGCFESHLKEEQITLNLDRAHNTYTHHKKNIYWMHKTHNKHCE